MTPITQIEDNEGIQKNARRYSRELWVPIGYAQIKEKRTLGGVD